MGLGDTSNFGAASKVERLRLRKPDPLLRQAKLRELDDEVESALEHAGAEWKCANGLNAWYSREFRQEDPERDQRIGFRQLRPEVVIASSMAEVVEASGCPKRRGPLPASTSLANA